MAMKKSTKIIYVVLWIFTVGVAIIIAIVMIYNMTRTVPVETWFSFWKHYIFILFWIGIPIVGLFIIGGFFDLMKLFKQLKEKRVDDSDDGFVQHPDE